MRIFLDTNVLASALGTRGLCTELLRLVLGDHELIISEQVLTELRRARTQEWKLPSEIIDDAEVELRLHHVEPVPKRLPHIPLRDPDDIPILASAIAAVADLLVTGDRNLLDVAASVPALRIADLRGGWEMLKRQSPPGG